ncbi:LpxI family protein [soil metagenome]
MHHADAALQAYEGEEAQVGEFGRAIALLSASGCTAVCFAGNVPRPDFATMQADAVGRAVLPALIEAAQSGDDALLRATAKVFTDAGFMLEGAHEAAGNASTLGVGPLGSVAPAPQAVPDIARALTVARSIGELEIGQGAVVVAGLVLAVEAQEGTDAMLARVASLPQALRGSPEARRGVLAKAPKPIQDLRLDMPVIGPRTVEAAAAAGLAGVAGEAGGVIVLDAEKTAAAADRLGLFVVGVPR